MKRGTGKATSPRSGTAPASAGAPRGGRTRAVFNPKLFAANLSHVTFDSVARWRQIMTQPPADRTEEDIDHVDHLVGGSRFFSKLEESQRREMYKVATYEACSAGEWLFRQGDVGNAFYIILVGQVDVMVSLVPESGDKGSSAIFEKHVSTLGPLDSFGEKALEDSDSLRKAGIRATELVELMRVSREEYCRVTNSWRERTAPDKIAFIRGTGFFPGWDDDQLFALAAKLSTESFDPGTRLVEEAGRKDTVDCYFVRIGECEVVARFGGGAPSTGGRTPSATRSRRRQQQGRLGSAREECITTLHKYDVFGTEALLLGSDVPNPHTIRAGTNVEVFVLKRDQLRDILQEHRLGKALEHRLRADLRARIAKGASYQRDQRGRKKWEQYKQSVVAHHISPTVLQDGALRVSLQGLVSDRRLELATLQVVSPRLRLALEDSFLRCGFSPTEMRRTAAATTAVDQASHITSEGGPAARPRASRTLASDDKGNDSDEDYGDIRDKALDGSSAAPTARVFESAYNNRQKRRPQSRRPGRERRSRPQSGLSAALWARARMGVEGKGRPSPAAPSTRGSRRGSGRGDGGDSATLKLLLRTSASAPVLPPLRIHTGGGGGSSSGGSPLGDRANNRSQRRRQ